MPAWGNCDPDATLGSFEGFRFVASDVIGLKERFENEVFSTENLIHRENPIYELPGVLIFALKTFEVFNTQYKMAASNFDEEGKSPRREAKNPTV